jgi:hypothetical protein
MYAAIIYKDKEKWAILNTPMTPKRNFSPEVMMKRMAALTNPLKN